MQYCEPTSMCCPSCSISCQIQNTTHRLSFALRATQRLFKYPGPNPSTLKMLLRLCLRAQTVQLPVGLFHSLFWLYAVRAPTLLLLTERLCNYPFGQHTQLTGYRLSTDGTCFRVTESSLTQACLDGPLLATVYRKPAFGRVTTLTLIWTLSRPS